MSQKFRYDINGLRAYAVALVVLFHFGVFGFAGGFIGVDVFFVISGFLMTSIIVKGLENKTFKFLKFYLSRANRIIPALVALCAVVGLVGWFTLTPQELKDYAKHAITSLGFISNIQYFKEAGYFDAASHEKLLLHTWSLSVEWQFYILLPIFLFLAYRIKQTKSALKIAFTGLFAVSLVLAIYLTPKMSSASFFLLPTRAWEMLAGGLIFLFFNKINLTQQRSTVIELTGFLLVAISVVSFTGSTPWPSYNAILPVLGTFLILLASNQKSLLTNNKVAQFLGNTSYSIYLWHWPLVFYLNYLEKSNNALWIIGAIILSVVLGWLSYRYIENPSRKFLSNLSLTKGYVVTFIYVAIPIVIFALIFIKHGFPSRLTQEEQNIIAQADNKNPMMSKCHIFSGLDLPECVHGTGEIGLLVVGDSHAMAMMPGVIKALPPNKSAIEWSYSGCPAVKGIKKLNSPELKCSEFIDTVLEKKDKYPNTPILIINRTNTLFHGAPDADMDLTKPLRYIGRPASAYDDVYYTKMKNAYIDTLCRFSEKHDVYVTTPVPVYPRNVPKYLVHQSIMTGKSDWKIPYSEHQKLSALTYEALQIASNKCGIKVLDTTKYFCDSSFCYPDKSGIPLYYDDDHLSVFGAEQLTPLFRTIFN